MNLQLTRNFRLQEFAVSRDHPELASAIEFSEPEIERIRFACAVFLQPLRIAFGPVTILSGKRSLELNTAVHGNSRSDHLFRGDTGAVDLTLTGRTPEEIAIWLLVNAPNFKYVIKYPERNFVHLSFPDSSGIYGEVRVIK